MRTAALPAIALAALLATAGCAAVGIGEEGPAPSDFPDAGEIDGETYDRHAEVLANTSFTATFTLNTTLHDPVGEPALFPNETHFDGTRTLAADPANRQYRLDSSGRWSPFPMQLNNGTVYANDLLQWTRNDDRNGAVTDGEPRFQFDPESGAYLWEWWHLFYDTPRLLGSDVPAVGFVSENVTYERQGIEQFRGTTVMRYAASGVDALRDAPRFAASENATVTAFSATLLLDADGVIRHFDVEYSYEIDGAETTYRFAHTVSGVGETSVERPAWVGPTVQA